jgi:hypothetical protein
MNSTEAAMVAVGLPNYKLVRGHAFRMRYAAPHLATGRPYEANTPLRSGLRTGFGVRYCGRGRLNPYWSEIFIRRGFWITDDNRISM